MDIERDVAAHYGDAALAQRLLGALSAAGLDTERLSVDDLAPVDEFHVGGRQATVDFAAQVGLRPGMKLLDVGSGIGGPARYFAQAHECAVTGIDLTDVFVRLATDLSRRAGLAGKTEFRQGSALALPFSPASFDGATLIHVGMNIADKARLFAGVRAVLKPGGVFGIFDLMRIGAGEIEFPVPWADRPETSFVEPAATYRGLLAAAGFTVEKERDRRAFALDFFRQMRARAEAAGGAPPLGPPLIMGPGFQDKLRHVAEAVGRGVLAPVELVARA
jgi:SAM-dependent methyltransferase